MKRPLPVRVLQNVQSSQKRHKLIRLLHSLFSPFTHAIGGHMPTPDFNPYPEAFQFTYQEHLSF